MDMDQLIKRFYDGVATPEEERFLKDFFLHSTDIDVRWRADQQLFVALYGEEESVPAGVSKRLEAMIDGMGASSPVPVAKRRHLFYRLTGVAAVILLCVGLFFATHRSAEPRMADTFNNPEEAALVAERTLAFMSSYLNKGLNQVADAGQEIEKVNEILNKQLK